MKVVHICTYDSGGAAKAAFRLHSALSKIDNVDSYFLTLNAISSDAESFSVPRSFLDRVYQWVKRRFDTRKHRRIATKNVEIISFPDTPYNVLKHHLVYEADIINLHWVAGFLDYSSFFTKIDKPVIWTFHDMNPFSGMIHYEGDLLGQNDAFLAIEQFIKLKKKQYISNCKNLHIVCPSQWLLNLAKKSNHFGAKTFNKITYGLDTLVFSTDREKARKHYQIEDNKFVFALVAQSLKNKRKGFDLVLDALAHLKPQIKEQICFLCVGEENDALSFESCFIQIGSIKKEEEMARLLSASNGTIISSREDNLPNVMLESLVVGTPVLGFAIGGLVETIHNGFNGILVDEIDAINLAKGIEQFVNTHFDRKKIRADAIIKYGEEKQAVEYYKLYNESLLKL